MISHIAKFLKLDGNVLNWVLHYNRPHTARIICNFIFSIIFALYNIVFTWILKTFVDIATGESNQSIAIILLLATFSMLVNGIACYYYRMNQTVIANKIECEVKADALDSVAKAKYSIFEKMHTADHLTRLTNDISHVTWFLIGTVDNQMQNLLKVIFSYIYLFILSWPVALIIMVMGCILPIINRIFQNKLKSLTIKRQELASENTTLLQEYLEGLRVIRIYKLPVYFIKKLRDLMQRKLNVEQKITKTTVFQNNVSAITETAMFFVSMALGAFFATKGYMAAGTMIAFIQLLNWIIWPFTNIANIGIRIQNDLIPAQRVYEMIKFPKYEKLIRKEESLINHTAVMFKNVTFAYNSNQTVLHNVSFEVNEFECVAIVGPTGSGKSTLTKLIMGEYRVKQGINLFGNNINNYSDDEICDIISYVPQDPWLFSGTLYENIKMGNLDATRDKIYEAAHNAYADEFILGLPEGYDTLVKDKGNNFSGGQRQRIVLARSFLKKSKIIILDEATSAIDQLTDQHILSYIRRLSRQKTVIIITHRLEIAKQCDRILYLDDGKIIESGSHNELMQINGSYKKLYEGKFETK